MHIGPCKQTLTTKPEPANAFDRLRRHFADLGGVELKPPPRLPGREPPTFLGSARIPRAGR